jgi:hypothetical protein
MQLKILCLAVECIFKVEGILLLLDPSYYLLERCDAMAQI